MRLKLLSRLRDDPWKSRREESSLRETWLLKIPTWLAGRRSWHVPGTSFRTLLQVPRAPYPGGLM